MFDCDILQPWKVQSKCGKRKVHHRTLCNHRILTGEVSLLPSSRIVLQKRRKGKDDGHAEQLEIWQNKCAQSVEPSIKTKPRLSHLLWIGVIAGQNLGRSKDILRED